MTAESPALDEIIAETLHLLPQMRTLSPARLSLLAHNLHALADIAEGMARDREDKVGPKPARKDESS